MTGSRNPDERTGGVILSRNTIRVIAAGVLLVGIALLYMAWTGNAREIDVRRNGTEVTAKVVAVSTKDAPGRIGYTLNGSAHECNLVAGRTVASKDQTLKVIASKSDPGVCVPASIDLTDLGRTAIVLLFGLGFTGCGAWLLRNA